jgi:O-antigen ligase
MLSTIDTLEPAKSDVLSNGTAGDARPRFMFAAAGLILIAFMVPFEQTWFRPSYDESEDEDRAELGARAGSIQRQIALGGIGLFGIASLTLLSDKRWRTYRPLGFVCIGLLAWCAASCLWTDNLGISLRRLIAFACEVFGAMALAQRASPRQFVWLVFICTFTWLGLGILAEVTQGTLQPWVSDYRFKGLFQANITSANCAFLVMSSLYLSSGSRARKSLLLVSGTAFVFLVLTGSRTGLGAMLASLMVVTVIKISTWKRLFVGEAVVAALVCILFVVGLGQFDFSTEWASKNRGEDEVATLTGRVPLWDQLLNEYVREKPLAGHGYGAFWTPKHINEVADTQGWSPAYAHSTYMDQLLGIGVIGALLYVSVMILAFIRAARLEVRYVEAAYGFIAMVIAYALTDGVCETTFGFTSFTSFFVICSVSFLVFHEERDAAYAVSQPPQLDHDPLFCPGAAAV